MKRFIITSLIAFVSVFVLNTFAADLKELVVKSSIQCEMCDKTVQKGLKKIDGVDKVATNIEKQQIIVKYNPETVTPEKIKTAITKLGYDADEMKAEQRAYVKLSKCCKKPEDRK